MILESSGKKDLLHRLLIWMGIATIINSFKKNKSEYMSLYISLA